ncbi:hypothetical protein K1719_018715 [Acacia pycnantha]|nr:hypothetical protein K1719_018715 [Acacia pycnantha]
MTMRGLNLKLHPLVLVSIIFLILSPMFFSPSNAEEGDDDDDDDTIKAWKKERSHQFNASNSNSTFVLAEERTRRIDPTNHFRYYEAGWNIIDSHYYASLLFSGAPTLYVAAVWFLGVVIFFFIALCCCCCCCKNRGRSSYSRTVYWGSLICTVIFLLAAIVGGTLVYTGQGHFQKATSRAIDNVGSRIRGVLDVLKEVLDNLDGAMKLNVGAYSLPGEYENNIQIFHDLVHSNSSNNPRVILENAITNADKFLATLSYVLIVVTAVMLILAVLGFIFSVCGWKGIVYFLFFIGWIIVTVTLILSSISLVVKNGIGDTCVAMEEWLEHPQERTSLSEVFPCVDGPTAQKTLDITRNTSFQMTNMVDTFVTNIANVDGAPPSVSYNQSGPLLPLLCNPFNSDMTRRQCDPQQVPLNNASQVYQGFVCKTLSADGGCTSVGRLTPNLYQQIMMAVNVSNSLYENGPKLIDLIDCTFVAETFNEIHDHYCPPMWRFSGFIFTGLLFLSLALLFSLISWLVFVRERLRHISSYNFI